MIEGNPSPNFPGATSPERLAADRVTVVYTMFHHLGDFVVMGGLLKKFDQLGAGFESLVAHQGSPHVECFEGETAGRFFDVSGPGGMAELWTRLRRRRREGRIVLGVPMAPGSVQAFGFFWVLKRLGALDYVVDFNLINADILTPPRRRYIFDRHLAQAAEIFKRPEWLEDVTMPLVIADGPGAPASPSDAARAGEPRRIGLFPWSGRSRLPEFQWPVERWALLVNQVLESFGGEVVLLGRDESFATFERTLRAQLPPERRARFNAQPASSVPALAGSLRAMDGLVTLNTSALHMAHALRLRTVVLCGSSAECWLPEGDHIRLVRDGKGALPPSDKMRHDPLQPSVQRIGAGEVFDACREHFSLRGADAKP